MVSLSYNNWVFNTVDLLDREGGRERELFRDGIRLLVGKGEWWPHPLLF